MPKRAFPPRGLRAAAHWSRGEKEDPEPEPVSLGVDAALAADAVRAFARALHSLGQMQVRCM